MILDELMGTLEKIENVVPSPNGGEGLDVWYNPEAITPEVLKAIRAIPDDTEEEDAIRDLLAKWGMEWNLKTYAMPGPDANPATTTTVTLPNGRTLTVMRDANGQPKKVPVPSTIEGMKNVSFRTIRKVYDAIMVDCRPKATSSNLPSSTS